MFSKCTIKNYVAKIKTIQVLSSMKRKQRMTQVKGKDETIKNAESN